ncbi:DUF6383 domain-containing protein [Parabacteroides sp. PF5-6]|uniref:DUF6383 domain-containing protein n=1 Tax=Parabacteroides sp. PF5-6 TaxID=1742403 RepID=UPI002405DFB3|nr:DUF6383 domain-containing protein [Parabacteroides sp. PF5-6]MDF9829989.1 putative Zn-dependent protease with MMP-like domain [Parabacteroides sp. PF5-6]
MNQINSRNNIGYKLFTFVFSFIAFLTVSTAVAHGKEIRTTASGLSEVTFYDANDNGKNLVKYNLKNWPEAAKQAVMEAMVITENSLNIKHTMRVAFAWSPDLDKDRNLALAYTSYVSVKGFSDFGIEIDENYKYPAELIHQMVGNPVYDCINITVIFNSVKDWCFSSKQQPTKNQQDLITVTLHELAHGFGISSSFNKSNEKTPYIFDKYIYNRLGDQLGESYATTKANASSELENTNLYYGGKMGVQANNGQQIQLHVPATLSSASICHFDMKYKNDERGRLLIAGTTYGVSTRAFGDFALGIFQDLGWELRTDTRAEVFSPNNEKSNTTANETIEQNPISIRTGAGSIQVDLNSFDPQRVAIYTLAGRQVRNELISGSATFDVPSGQIYIVRIGNKSEKVMVN